MTHFFVVIAGNIGVGKSTFTDLLVQRLGWTALAENVAENPFLDRFYQDMRRWAFHSQMFYLTQQLKKFPLLAEQTNTVVQDRCIYEDAEIFARNLFERGDIPKEDYVLYEELYQAIKAIMPSPDLIVFLQASLETLLGRIRKRGREAENKISVEYLSQLQGLYANWAESFDLCPILHIETDGLDLVDNPNHIDMVIEKTLKELRT